MGNRELLAIKLALEEWRHWLEGAKYPFIAYTDHKNLEYLKSAKHLNPRQARVSLFFTRFNFSVSYHPSSENKKFPERSSQPENTTILPLTHHINAIQWEFDKDLQNTLAYNIPSKFPEDKQYVPPRLRYRLITWAHNSLAMGHPGTQCTWEILKGKYWWPSMCKEINEFIFSCARGTQATVPRHLPEVHGRTSTSLIYQLLKKEQLLW